MTNHVNNKLGALVGKMLGVLGGAFSVPAARIGYRLGLFETQGAARFSELAARTGLAEPYFLPRMGVGVGRQPLLQLSVMRA